MDRINENRNTNDDELAFESGMRFLDETLKGDGIRTEIVSLGNKIAHHARDTYTILALLTDSAIMASPDVADKGNSAAAQGAFLKGTMTGLYVAKELLGDYLTPELVLSSIQTLSEQDSDGRVSSVGLMQEGEKLLGQMQPKTRKILDRWAKMCDSSGEYKDLYKLGFGLTMGGANKAMYEAELFKSLESMTGWGMPAEREGGFYTESVDEDCRGLASSFQIHAVSVGLGAELDAVFIDKLTQIATLLERDFSEMKELKIDDRIQTRGAGLYMAIDEKGKPDDICLVDDETRIRGSLIGVECLPVPTDYALIVMVFDDETLYEPLACLMLEDVELVESDGSITKHEGIVALPLRVDGVHVDKLVYGPENW